MIVFPSISGSRSEISSLTMSEPLWNPDVGRGLDRFAVTSQFYIWIHFFTQSRSILVYPVSESRIELIYVYNPQVLVLA